MSLVKYFSNDIKKSLKLPVDRILILRYLSAFAEINQNEDSSDDDDQDGVHAVEDENGIFLLFFLYL